MVGKTKWTRFRSKGGFYYSSSGGPSYSANVSLGMGYGYGMVSVNIGVASNKSGSGQFLLAPNTKNYFRPWAKKRIKYRVYSVQHRTRRKGKWTRWRTIDRRIKSYGWNKKDVWLKKL